MRLPTLAFLHSKMILTVLTVILPLVVGQTTSQDSKSNTLPLPIIDDIISILINGTIQYLSNCSSDEEASKVSYWIADKDSEQLLPLTTYTQVNPSLRPVYLLHGWMSNRNAHYIQRIKSSYHKFRPDVQIFLIDFEEYVNSFYMTAVRCLPKVARNFARHLCRMKQNAKMFLEEVHLVGHSLGAQLAGLTGQEVKDFRCGTIGRITALDPAGPIYRSSEPDFRLDKDDALFVDTIHTNTEQFGYPGQVGHVDFYVNCGMYQPGCVPYLRNVSTHEHIPQTYVLMACSHERSNYLFAESIERNAFRGTACPMCHDAVCPPMMEKPSYAYMGESCRQPTEYEEYYVRTNKIAPYGQGPEAPETTTSNAITTV